MGGAGEADFRIQLRLGFAVVEVEFCENRQSGSRLGSRRIKSGCAAASADASRRDGEDKCHVRPQILLAVVEMLP
jgi:hypothetical protein